MLAVAGPPSTTRPDPAPVVGSIPAALPAGQVRRLAGGGPFGLMVEGLAARVFLGT